MVETLTIISLIGLSLSFLVSCVFLHEGGHLWYARIKEKKARLVFEGINPTVIVDATGWGIEERRSFYASGVLFGFVPLILLGLLPIRWEWFVYETTILVYVLGCWSDISALWRPNTSGEVES